MIRNGKFAFTLVELLVVITVISVLAALLLPALENALQQARTVYCANNQRQLYLAMTQYADSWNGVIGKKDQGRGPAAAGVYAQYLNRIIQVGYPVGDQRITIDHGSWLEGGLADPSLYFCPDVTWDHVWGGVYGGPVGIHKRAYTGYMRPLLESGGKEWSVKSNTVQGGTPDVNYVWLYNQTSYSFNRLLLPDVYYGLYWQNTPLVRVDGAGWKIHDTKPEIPLLADSRSYAYSSSYHDGRGWNVCYMDGAVAFCTTAGVVNTGIENNVSPRYQQWIGYSRAPDNPQKDPDILLSGNRPVMHSTTGMDERFGRVWTTFYYMRH